MNFRHLLLSLALLAGIFVLPGCKKAVENKEYKVLISPVNSPYTMTATGHVRVKFKAKIYMNGQEVTDYEENRVDCEITAQGGTVINYTTYRTGKQGDIDLEYRAADLEHFSGGSVEVKPVLLLCKNFTFKNFGGDKSAVAVINPAQ